jgi:hypothetical protein
MKNITKLFAIAIAVIGFSATSFAQSSATADATATLITPISIAKDVDLNFGTISSSATDGTITISNAGVASQTGGATLISGGAARTAAKFTVTGESGSTITVSCPTTINLTSGSNTLVVNAIAPDSGATTAIGSGGTKVINVGGTLVVPGASVGGVYTNTTDLTVTVNYQ